jgi:hypothetical protein
MCLKDENRHLCWMAVFYKIPSQNDLRLPSLPQAGEDPSSDLTFRSCIHNREIPDGRGIFRPAKHKNTIQPLWLTSFCNAAGRKKTRPDGVKRL